MEVVLEMATEFGLTGAILSDDPANATDTLSMFVANHTSFVISKTALTSQVAVLVTDYVGVTIQEGMGCRPYLFKHSEFLRSLVPNDNIREIVDSVKQSYFSDRMMIGVHVRIHDPDQDWAVVPPLDSQLADNRRAVNFGVGATVEDFIYYMRQIQAALPQQVRFFVASNDKESKDEILRNFLSADAIVVNGEYGRDSTQGMAFALIEWLLLSEAALVINTHGSSFAVEASQRYQRPLVGIYNGRLLHLYNIFLPFCSHLLFLKTYGRQGQEEIYIEDDGASFKREIVGKHVLMQPCNFLEEWGLGEVYCVNSDSKEETLSA